MGKKSRRQRSNARREAAVASQSNPSNARREAAVASQSNPSNARANQSNPSNALAVPVQSSLSSATIDQASDPLKEKIEELKEALKTALESTNPPEGAKRIYELINKTQKTTRELQDLYRELVQFTHNDTWNGGRYVMFCCYIKYLRNQVLGDSVAEISAADMKFLRRVSRSDTEPAFYVAVATEALGLIQFLTEYDVDAHFHCLKRVISTCDSADAKEKERQLHLLNPPMTVGEYLSKLRGPITGTIKQFREENTILPGDQCDGCGKTAPEWEELPVCNRCRLTYYCSPQCQETHWKEVHSKLCRQKGEFQIGDVVRTLQSFGSVEFGHLCRIVGSAPESAESECDNWLVSSRKEPEEASAVSADKLRVDPWFVRGKYLVS